MRADARLIVTPRTFLEAIGLAISARLRSRRRPLATPFTSIEGADLAWLARWFCFGGGSRFAGAG